MSYLVSQPTQAPSRKMAGAGLGGVLTTLIIAVLSQVGVDISPDVAAAIATLLSFLVGYFVKERAQV